MLEQLLESLDKEVYTAEMLESIQTQFNEAVISKAEELAEEFIAESLQTKTVQLEESAEAYIAEMLEAKTNEIQEKADEYVAESIKEINESLDLFMDNVVEEFIAESKSKLDESLKSAKADMIIEAYEAMIVAGSLDVAKIVESKNESSAEAKLAESTNKYNELMVEHLELKKEKDTLIKTGMIMEMKEGLSLVESKKFEKLAEMVPFTQDEKFIERLAVIKESVSGVSEKETKEEPIVNESVKDVKVDKKPASADFSHLV